MKMIFLAVTLMGLLVLGAREVQAQAYGPYPILGWSSVPTVPATNMTLHLSYM